MPPTSPIPTRSRLLGIVLVLAAVFFWSLVPVAVRALMRPGAGAFSPALMGALRLWLAAVGFLALAGWRVPWRNVPRNAWGWAIAGAVALPLNYFFYALGLRDTTAAATSIISQVSPVVAVLLAALFQGERITLRKVIGMVAATVGVAVVVIEGESMAALLASQHFVGNAIEVLASLLWPVFLVVQTKVIAGVGARAALALLFLLSALCSTLLLPSGGPILLHSPGIGDWALLAFLGLGATFGGYALFAAGVKHIETSEGAMFNVLIPVLALVAAHLLLSEPIGDSLLLGTALVVAGLGVMMWRVKRDT